jgi:hypothetical protein
VRNPAPVQLPGHVQRAEEKDDNKYQPSCEHR